MPNLKLDRSLFNRQNREQAIEVLRMAAQLVGGQAELARRGTSCRGVGTARWWNAIFRCAAAVRPITVRLTGNPSCCLDLSFRIGKHEALQWP